MKRIIICIAIIAAIIALGCSAIAYIEVNNSKLYGKIDKVISSFDMDSEVESSIADLNDYFKKYKKMLGCIVGDDELYEMELSISRLLPMYQSDCDEFTAECNQIKTCAKKMLDAEMPYWYRIL